jgi:transposase
MLKITNPTVPREQVWAAFRKRHDVRWRERYHGIWLLRDGKRCPEIAPWLYRDEETIRSWVQAVHEAGLPGLEREPIPGRPS